MLIIMLTSMILILCSVIVPTQQMLNWGPFATTTGTLHLSTPSHNLFKVVVVLYMASLYCFFQFCVFCITFLNLVFFVNELFFL